MTLGLSGTVVLASRFDPEATLALVARTRADALIVVPVMLHRMLALDDRVFAEHPTPSLRIIASKAGRSGRHSPCGLSTVRPRPLQHVRLNGSVDRHGRDSRRSEGAARHGRPTVLTTRVQVLDNAGRPAPTGNTGRVFVGSDLRFDGYTGGRRSGGGGCCPRAMSATSIHPADS